MGEQSQEPNGTVGGERERLLRELLDRYGARIRAVISTVGLHRQGIQPDDVEQEVRIRLWQALGRESEVRHPASYIMRIVRSVTIDALRRAAARPAAALGSAVEGEPEDEVVAEVGQAGGDPQASLAGQALVADIERVLGQFGEERAQAVRLLLQGFTTEEIGRLQDWTEAKARNLAYRGLSDLRVRLAEMGYDHGL